MSNTWVTYPRVGNNSSKGELIPHKTTASLGDVVKGGLIGEVFGTVFPSGGWSSALCTVKLLLEEGPAAHQLVGRVTAYQGNDG